MATSIATMATNIAAMSANIATMATSIATKATEIACMASMLTRLSRYQQPCSCTLCAAIDNKVIRKKLVSAEYVTCRTSTFVSKRKLVQYPNRNCGARIWLLKLVTVLWWRSKDGYSSGDDNCDSPRDYQRMTTIIEMVTILGMVTFLGTVNVPEIMNILMIVRPANYITYSLRNIIWCSYIKFWTDNQTDRQYHI